MVSKASREFLCHFYSVYEKSASKICGCKKKVLPLHPQNKRVADMAQLVEQRIRNA